MNLEKKHHTTLMAAGSDLSRVFEQKVPKGALKNNRAFLGPNYFQYITKIKYDFFVYSEKFS